MEKIKIESNEEYDAVITEIIERHRDAVLLNMVRAIKNTKEFLDNMFDRFQGGDEINFNYTITMVPGDFLQILAKVRREKIKK